jgi:hypothetical protein
MKKFNQNIFTLQTTSTVEFHLKMDPEGPSDNCSLNSMSSEPSSLDVQKVKRKYNLGLTNEQKREIRRISNREAASHVRQRREHMIRNLEGTVYIITGEYPNFKKMVNESRLFDQYVSQPDTHEKRTYVSNKNATSDVLDQKKQKRRLQNNSSARTYRLKRAWYVSKLQEIVGSCSQE